MKAFERVGVARFGSISLGCLIAALVFEPANSAFSQAAKKDKDQQKDQQKSGYLSKLPPSGLRFAPPPRPPVAYLPPLPISHDPQPVFSPEFAQPISEIPVQPIIHPPPPPRSITSLPITELTSILTNKSKIPESSSVPNVLNPQMFVKFFQHGKPGEGEGNSPSSITFRAPVKDERRSSSANYEVK